MGSEWLRLPLLGWWVVRAEPCVLPLARLWALGLLPQTSVPGVQPSRGPALPGALPAPLTPSPAPPVGGSRTPIRGSGLSLLNSFDLSSETSLQPFLLLLAGVRLPESEAGTAAARGGLPWHGPGLLS